MVNRSHGLRLFARNCSLVVLVALGCSDSHVIAAEPPQAQAVQGHIAAGDARLRVGNFEGALAEWSRALQGMGTQSQPLARSDIWLRQAEALRALGFLERALVALRQAAVLAEADEARMARILASLGDVLLSAGSAKEAQEQLESAIALSRKTARKDIEAVAVVNLGNALAGTGTAEEAIARYREGAELAAQSGNLLLRGQALINAARVAAGGDKPESAAGFLQAAGAALGSLKASHDVAYALTSLGQVYLRLQKNKPSQAWVDGAARSLNAALKMAQGIGDSRAEAYALGYLGELYENEGRIAEAQDLTRRALFLAERLNAPELLFRGNWQNGRLLRAQNDPVGAVAAYRRAVEQLQSFRSDLIARYASGGSSFREVLGPVYFELADLLLQQGTAARDPVVRQKLLAEARDTIERSKSAEMQDYFRDNCVTALQSKITQVENVGANTVVIYPIILSDRLELLATFADGIKQVRVPVDSKSLVEGIRRYRLGLERRTTRQYLPLAQQLYGWLVKPLEAELAARGTDTLVFVPDGALRTVPLSALHDGKQFLISRFAIATTPGLTLTDPHPLQARASRTLLIGLTLPVQGFSALPEVAVELKSLQETEGGKLLQDQDYVLKNVQDEFAQKPITVLHIASHGQFNSDASKTFLLTYDGKLTMDQLEKLIAPSRYRDEPLELLALSACQTAAGDDRAALGLAGVAIKAGARSALASLWFVNDQSSTLLVTEFYHHLRQPGVSKAKALQQAQLKMIGDNRFSHPGYWAPYLLIGNWL